MTMTIVTTSNIAVVVIMIVITKSFNLPGMIMTIMTKPLSGT